MKVRDVDRHEGEPPNDKIHRIAQAMLNAWENHPEHEGVHVIAFVTEDLDGFSNATTGLGGYEQDGDAFVDMMAHMTAVAKANGMKMSWVPLEGPVGEG